MTFHAANRRVHSWSRATIGEGALCLVAAVLISGVSHRSGAQPAVRPVESARQAAPLTAAETLFVYGPGGPLPAMKEAAAAYQRMHGVTVQVTGGPTPQWLDRARTDADVVFSGAEHMMTDFVRQLGDTAGGQGARPGRIDESTIAPLYLRPVAMLVRPGNPKRIHRFEDLLRPGVKVLVVQGAGQTGLWEDVAGRTGDIRVVRAFRRNIGAFAENSGVARQRWKDDASFDAWLIWNIWQVANPTLAESVPVAERWRIYRDAGVALTMKGRERASARDFVAFLQSAEGARIFARWGWMTAASTAAGASGIVRILHTNDIHGDLREFAVDTGDATAQTGDPGRPYQQYPRAGIIGGFARLATAVQAIRRAHGEQNVILVDAGDTFGDQLLSNLTRGEATLRMMDALGYAFMALGNHDYEYTAENTRRLQGLVHFPMRAANAIVAATGEPFLGDPTTVVTVGGVRVGLLALTYHNTDQTGNRDNTKALQFRSGIDVARQYVPALRQRSDIVVVVSHQGTVVDSLLGERVPGIDVIVGGHSHDRIQPPRRVGGAWMVQALSDASALGELTLTVRDGKLVHVEGAVHELYADRHEPDPRFTALLDSIRAPFRDTLEAVIATATNRIGRQYKSESPVDVLAADILRVHGGADAAFLPGLGFGVTIQPGPITREMIVGMFPHPTSVVREVLTGAQILEVLEQSATNLRPANDMDRVGGLVQTAGVRWTVDLTRPVGQRIHDVEVGGVPLEPARRYVVMTNGGLLQGTHRYTTFARGAEITRDAKPFAVILEEALRQKQLVSAPTLGAVTMVK